MVGISINLTYVFYETLGKKDVVFSEKRPLFCLPNSEYCANPITKSLSDLPCLYFVFYSNIKTKPMCFIKH